MAFNDVKSISANIDKKDVEGLLIGLGRVMNKYVVTPLPERANLSDFFHAFSEGDREITPKQFFVQRRINPRGRVGIRYDFPSVDATQGIIGFSAYDNGENVPTETLNGVFLDIKKYLQKRGLVITEETTSKEM